VKRFDQSRFASMRERMASASQTGSESSSILQAERRCRRHDYLVRWRLEPLERLHVHCCAMVGKIGGPVVYPCSLDPGRMWAILPGPKVSCET
jgi:hypothetical protein